MPGQGLRFCGVPLGQIARAVRAKSEQVEGLYLSPVLPASRDYTASVINDLVSRYDLDGIHLDYLRYPNEQFDYSAGTIAAFSSVAMRLRSARCPAVSLRSARSTSMPKSKSSSVPRE